MKTAKTTYYCNMGYFVVVTILTPPSGFDVAICMLIGCTVYPAGWENDEVRAICGVNAGKYNKGVVKVTCKTFLYKHIYFTKTEHCLQYAPRLIDIRLFLLSVVVIAVVSAIVIIVISGGGTVAVVVVVVVVVYSIEDIINGCHCGLLAYVAILRVLLS